MRLVYKILIVMLIVAVVPLSIAGWQIISINQRAQLSLVREAHTERAGDISKIIDEKYVQSWFNCVGTITATQELYAIGDKDRQALLFALVTQYEDLDILVLYDDQNNPLSWAMEEAISREIVENKNLINDFATYQNEEAIAEAKLNGDYIGTMFVPPNLNTPYLTIAMTTLLSEDRSGVLVAKISLEHLIETISQEDFRKRGVVFLVDETGKLIAHSDEKFDFQKDFSDHVMVVSYLDSPGSAHSTSFLNHLNEKMLGSYDSTTMVPWCVIVEEPEEDAYLAVRQMRRNLLAWLLFSVLVSATGALVMARRISKPVTIVARGADEIAKGNFELQITNSHKKSKDEIGQLTRAFNHMASSLAEKEKIKGAFSRFVPPLVVREILQDLDNISLSGKRIKVAVMFVDIRGFTSLSESLPAEDVVNILNSFLESMIQVVFKYRGTLDKFLGDGFMAFWGAPIAHENDPLLSVKAALSMFDKLKDLNETYRKERELDLKIGIGIDYGDAIVGKTGAEIRMEYTAVGDTVNTASRLCGIAEPGQIIVSRSTYELAKNEIQFDTLEPVRLKGKENPVEIFDAKNLIFTV